MGCDVVGTRMTTDQAMELALEVALGGVGKVSPNPLVGAVLLGPDGVCLAAGYHSQLGGPHAEVHLLEKISDSQVPKGSTLLVTLEPCSHEGRTPSCAHRLAKLPLKEVLYGLADPGQASGGGARIIEEAGIKATEYQGPLKIRLKELCEIFYHNVQTGRSFVALKCGTTLDGKIAIKETGESKWITGEESLKYSHFLRAMYDAVLVGEQTFAVDDPSLNVRHPDFPKHQGQAIVLSPRSEAWGKLESSSLRKIHEPKNILWVCGEGFEPRDSGGVRVLPVPFKSESLLDISFLLTALPKEGVHSVLVEGGANTISTFLTEGSAQRLHLFVAPKILGGKGLGWAEDFVAEKLSKAVSLRSGQWRSMGEDLYFTARF